MSQQQPNVVQTFQIPTGGNDHAHSQNGLTFDLIVIEAGLRLKVLPLRDAILEGRKLRLSELERRTRQCALAELCGNTRPRIVDVGLFADAVARRPHLAERLRRALRSNSR